MPPSVIEFRGISKYFGGAAALDNVSFSIQRGTIHGIIGENGAGKSTLMKILYGIYQPSAGAIFLNGSERRFAKSRDAIASGIGMVHQHFMLAGSLSAVDNIIVGAEPTRWGCIDRAAARARLQETIRLYGLPVDLERPVEEMPVGIQQRIEILKLLYRNSEIIILDEPTAVLTPRETQNLFDQLRQLKLQGKTIILITHKLKEVIALTDNITVLRAGKVAGQMATSQTDAPSLARLMVGRSVAIHQPLAAAQPNPTRVLEVAGLSTRALPGEGPSLSDISFIIQKGEIVGIAGVEANGQTPLLQCLLRPLSFKDRLTGRIELRGEDITHSSARNIRDAGVAVIPEDRLAAALLPEATLEENFLLGLQRRTEFQRGGFLRRRNLRQVAAREINRYDVRPNVLSLSAKYLSGGNQQKLITAREFFRDPELVIAAQPTRGVDIAAVELIHGKIVSARDSGAGVLLISSDLDEILALSDRILVIYEGRIAATFGKGEASEKALGLKMGGM
jgi:simple sugar transport system ATP-binding protein